MSKIAEAFVEVTGRTGKYRANIKKAQRLTTGFGKTAVKSIKGITIGLAAMGIAAGVAAVAIGVKLARAIVNAGRSVTAAAVTYDKLKLGLLAVAGSSQEARQQLERLSVVAELPGLSFREAIAGSTALQAAGLEARLAERSLVAFGNALVTVGKGAAELKGVNLALTQIVTKGRGFGQELRQLSERLPQVRKAMKDAFGATSAEEMDKLGLTAKEFIEGLVKEFEKLPKISGTVANSIENLGISFDRLKADIGEALLPSVKAVSEGLTGIIGDIRAILPHWRAYQDEVIVIFGNITKIILQTTGIMMKAIGDIIGASAPLIFEPIKFHGLRKLKEFGTGFILLWNDMLTKIGVHTKEQSDQFLSDVMDNQRKEQSDAARQYEKDYKQAIDNIISAAVTNLPKINTGILDGLKDIKAETASIADEARRLTALKNALLDIGISIRDLFKGAFRPEITGEDLQNLKTGLKSMGADFAAFFKSLFAPDDVGESLEDALKRIGDFNRRSESLFVEENEARRSRIQALKEFMMEQEQEIADFKAQIRSQEITAAKEQAEDVRSTLQPIFQNMFEGLLSGDSKNRWEDFWEDLKRIAIRQLAAIAATNLLSGLLPGLGPGTGGLAAAGGLGPLAPALGILGASGALGKVGGDVGGLFGSGRTSRAGLPADMIPNNAPESRDVPMGDTIINITEQDLSKLDPQRIRKTLEQDLLPVLENLKADGIGA